MERTKAKKRKRKGFQTQKNVSDTFFNMAVCNVYILIKPRAVLLSCDSMNTRRKTPSSKNSNEKNEGKQKKN